MALFKEGDLFEFENKEFRSWQSATPTEVEATSPVDQVRWTGRAA